jgi:hypothetical protein
MRLLVGIAILGVAALFLGGCPIYPSQGNEYRVCDGTGCYNCPDPSRSGACISWQCYSDSDCDTGYVCAPSGQCVLAGTYDASPPPDCSQVGCPAGLICKLSKGVPECVSLDSGGGGTVDAGPGDAALVDVHTVDVSSVDVSAGDGAVATDGSSVDSAPAPDAPTITYDCNSTTQCLSLLGPGSKCVDGMCTAQLGLCSDGSQCVVQGSACVDGICEPVCSATAPCPSGYSCDFNRGVCNLNPGACSGAGASTCLGGAVCVETHCVPPCASTDGAAACATGLVCVNGGCIPDEAAFFRCANDGDQGLLANKCPANYTCIHHDCVQACDPDAGAGGCGSPTSVSVEVCKNVTIETGTYGICGTATTFGSECDPAQGKYCTAGVCIDGYCR